MKIRFLCTIRKMLDHTLTKRKVLTLCEFSRQYAYDRRKDGEKLYEGRCGSVLGMVKHLEAFGGNDIPLERVDVDTCKRFTKYLRAANDQHHHIKKTRKLSDSTIRLKLNILKSVLKEAVRQGLLDRDPFEQLPISHCTKVQYKERAALTKEELQKLNETPCDTPLLKEAFMLSCMTGLRKSDILSLSAQDIQKCDDTYYIYKKIKKTQRWIKLPLPEAAYHIITKLQAENKNANLLFSKLSANHLNRNLRAWIQIGGIEGKHITFHSGSHSKFFYLLNISELSILKNVTANDLETSYILFLSQLCNIQRTL